MPRPLRIDYEGAWHHVMNRGAGRRELFAGERERAVFLELLAAACEQHSLAVHAYCLMSNHFHLLVESRAGTLSGAMRDVTGRFTRMANAWRRTDGPMFRGRYHSVLVRDERQLLLASRYVHLNPVAAGLCPSAVDWPWSSARAYLALAPEPRFLATTGLLELFEPSSARQDYAEFLASGIDAPTHAFYARFRMPAAPPDRTRK